MEDKRLDLDAPLLSVRRFASEPVSGPKPPASAAASRNPNPRRSALPFYKSDLKSGPIRNPGVVPFVWEQSPGRPKNSSSVPPSAAPKLPPGRILAEKESANPPAVEAEDKKKGSLAISEECCDDEEEEEEEEEEEKFSDALETLSRTESYFMNCSISGLSEMTERMQPSGSFSTDPQVRDFMMGRFLPAAKAVATASPHSSYRKPPVAAVPARESMRIVEERVENGEQRRVRFPNGANFTQEREGASCSYGDDDEEEEEVEYYGSGHLSAKGCGFLTKFCLKSSFCLLNPVPGMKVSGHRLPPTSVRRIRGPQVKATQNGSLGQAEEEYSWEAVYKHKLMHGNSPSPGEDGGKLTSESNHLTYCSDSLTADGSYSQRRSTISGISPYRNEPSQSPFHEGKVFLGVPRGERKSPKKDGFDSEKDSENCWVITPHRSSQGGSGSLSPAVERTLHVDTVHMPETPMSKSSSLGTSSDNKGIARSADEVSEVGVQSQWMDESVLETCDEDALQSKATEVNEIGPKICPESSACGEMQENNGFKPSDMDDSPLPIKENNQVKNNADPMLLLLPPSLPNSPSESWLSRTLPSVSLKNPSAQSFLGMNLQARKQMSSSSSTVPKKELTIKPPKAQCGQTRFADMLAKPLSPQSEI